MSQQKPFELLARIDHQCRSSARGLPAQVDIAPHWSGIGFRLMGLPMVAPMGEVVEMLQLPAYTRLPGVHAWVRGVANVRGRLLPLFDLTVFFGGQPRASRQESRVLVLEMGELYSGLIVDEVLGMQHFSIDSFTSSIPEELAHLAQYLNGSYVQADTSWFVFSPFELARDPRFFNAAAV